MVETPFCAVLVEFCQLYRSHFLPRAAGCNVDSDVDGRAKKALRFAVYTTLASVLGGMIGYAVGYFAFDWVSGYIQSWGLQAKFDQAQLWFETWGVVVVFLAGFSPIPFKAFTICAGVMNMAFLPFVLSAAVSRFARFFLVARLSAWGGEKYADKIRHYIEMLGWGTVALAVIGYAVYSFTH